MPFLQKIFDICWSIKGTSANSRQFYAGSSFSFFEKHFKKGIGMSLGSLAHDWFGVGKPIGKPVGSFPIAKRASNQPVECSILQETASSGKVFYRPYIPNLKSSGNLSERLGYAKLEGRHLDKPSGTHPYVLLRSLSAGGNSEYKGIGSGLVQATIETSFNKENGGMVMLTPLPTAHDFFKKMGFTKTSDRFIKYTKKSMPFWFERIQQQPILDETKRNLERCRSAVGPAFIGSHLPKIDISGPTLRSIGENQFY